MGMKRILIIDDEKEMVDLLQMRLEAADYEILVAYDSQEGLDKARAEKPDLILLDIMMPKMNGYQVCRELKIDDGTKGIPVVMLTAKAQESDKFWGTEVGADAYVTKPFEASELLEKIRGFLESTQK